ncbi:MAG TPA: HigA family addiction module antitoxin [Terriglobales bacterium]|nr:HigA family addiction module antitoxin [Terriglobales bacterium]
MRDWKEPIHAGEILGDELKEIDMTAAELAKRIGVPNNRLYQIINGKRDITADTALRLGQFFGTGPEFWMNLQKAYELDVGRQKIGDKLKRIKRYDHAAHPRT